MLERMLIRLGHEPIIVTMPSPEQLQSADVLLVEPAAASGAVLTQTACVLTPTLPVICASVAEPPPELTEMGVVFSAILIKPFTGKQLQEAIDKALSRGPEPHTDRCPAL